MYTLNSMDSMHDFYATCGYKKERTHQGEGFLIDDQESKGYFEIIGDLSVAYFIRANIHYSKEICIRRIVKDPYIELCYNEPIDVVYYQKRKELVSIEPGLNCYVNAVPSQFFMRVGANTTVSYSSIVLREAFFNQNQLKLPSSFWNDCASVLNPNGIVLPALVGLLKQLDSTKLSGFALQTYLRGKFLEATALVMDYVEKSKIRKNIYITEKDFLSIQEARRILHEQFTNPPKVCQLAELVGLNQNKLQEGFRQTVGMSVYDFIRHLRMERSIEYLENSKISISQIAKKVGYQSKINFYNTFRATFNMTPKEMRGLFLKSDKDIISRSSYI